MPVHMSALNGYTECVKKFLTTESEIDVTDGRGRTALHCAACSGNIACLDLLLSAGKIEKYGRSRQKIRALFNRLPPKE